jgi:hypothetical protein
MGTPGLTPRHLTRAAGVVVGTTLLGGLLAVIDPTAAGRTAPHPALAGTSGEALSTLANNTAALAVPYVMWALGMPRRRLSRRLGDLVIAVVTGQSAVPVGIAMAHWRMRLLPYIPQLPLEWAALTIAVGAWLGARDGRAAGQGLTVLAAISLVLLTAAAGLETWATPHRGAPPTAGTLRSVNTASPDISGDHDAVEQLRGRLSDTPTPAGRAPRDLGPADLARITFEVADTDGGSDAVR